MNEGMAYCSVLSVIRACSLAAPRALAGQGDWMPGTGSQCLT